MKPSELFKKEKDKLTTIYDEREAGNLIYMLFDHYLDLPRSRVISNQRNLSEDEVFTLEQCVLRLLKHEPVQYITGEAEFLGHSFIVNPNVLIPRPETEELVNLIISDYYSTPALKDSLHPLKFLDIGTGSGCIIITLKKNMPFIEAYGLDVDNHTLEVAHQNAMKHQADVDFFLMDILNEMNWEKLPNFDIIVSNPPYIPEEERAEMGKNVVDFEPSRALFVDSAQPLVFYEKIAEFGKVNLAPGGRVYLETHENLAGEVASLFKKTGYNKIKVLCDLNGKERLISCSFKKLV